MPLHWILIALALVSLAFWWALRRSNELFCIRVKGGEPRLVRGNAPPRLYEDLGEVFQMARLEDAEVRLVVEGGSPRVLTRGISAGTEQQIRNVVGIWKLAQLRSARRK